MEQKHHEKINKNKLTIMCGHCFNETIHEIVYENIGHKLYEEMDDGKYYELFKFIMLKCTTCDCVSLYGDFIWDGDKSVHDLELLYPSFGVLGRAVPEKIRNIYKEIRPIREKAPNAFANQIRIALELLCEDKRASGSNLFSKLNDLSNKGIFPGQILSEMVNVIREVGNLGSHASGIQLDIWDVQLLDDIFLMIIDYTYIYPEKLIELKRRIEYRINSNKT